MKILLTGGGGMVGRNFLEHPDMAEHQVLAPRSTELDLLDVASVSRYLERHRPDAVVHAAGRVGGIHANMREPVRFLTENWDMGRNLVLAARATGVTRLLNLGSSCMYPRNAPNPLREEMILQGELEPTNEGYALAKVSVMRLCEYIAREDAQFLYKTLIPCNIYGPYDKFDPVNSHLIPAIIDKVHLAKLRGESRVTIWGDGEARREFMYAGDLAGCMTRALAHFDTLPTAMNVGIGSDLTINEYYRAIAEVVGYTGGFEHDLSKPVGMKQKLVATDKAETWGWKSGVSLHDGVALTYRYYLEHTDRGSIRS